MTAYASEKPVLLIKKLAGLVLVIFGCFLTAGGLTTGANALTATGIVLLLAGLGLLVLKIVRRNQDMRR
jgi:uncharacterized membrane protein YjjP (DUF1212 family)